MEMVVKNLGYQIQYVIYSKFFYFGNIILREVNGIG